MNIVFGSSTSPTNTLAFRNVSRFYMSIAGEDDKYSYIRLEEHYGIITEQTEVPKNYMFVYVIEFFDKTEPVVLPVKDFVINTIIS